MEELVTTIGVQLMMKYTADKGSKNNWGPFMKSHGYQAAFDDKGIYTGEVSANLFWSSTSV
ncbi:hypothetical protein P7H22_24925 [Paenibacillus larvae]|nr:hypothetical protein [Paenibacillus larvae]MDT2242927.1 hypothetical protein [Paenibacillus larvae]